MKKLIYLSLSIFFMTACCPEPDPVSVSVAELIVGEWVYDAPQDGRWEEVKLLSNGKLYYSSFGLNPYLFIENADGTYYFTSGDTKMTFAYPAVVGGMVYSDVEVVKIDKYASTWTFTNSNGSYGGTFVYHRLVDRVKVPLNGSLSLDYNEAITDSEIRSYSSNDESLVKVDSKTGEITVNDKVGQTYVCVNTANGEAYVEVIVYDPKNLFPDYSSALNMNRMEVMDKWGDYNKEYANTMRYPIRGNEYAKLATIWLDESDNVNYVQIELKTPVSISTTEKKVHDYLSEKYEFQYEEDGVYTYFDFSQPEILPMAVFYMPSKNLVEYLKLDLNYDLWTDYTQEFGKSVEELKEVYGSPFYEEGGSLYFIEENDYIDFVGFTISEVTSTVYAAGAFLKADCDWQEALDYVASKYYFYEEGSDVEEYSFAFIDASTVQEAAVGIIFDGVTGLITYVDLTASRSSSTRNGLNTIPEVIINRPKRL